MQKPGPSTRTGGRAGGWIPPFATARPLTPEGARNLPQVGRSAAQDEPQQPLTSDGPPFAATTQPASLRRETTNSQLPPPAAAPHPIQLR